MEYQNIQQVSRNRHQDRLKRQMRIVKPTATDEEIQRMCDRVAILVGGSLVAEGDFEELADQYDEPDFEELFYKLLLKHESQDDLAEV